MTGGLSQSARVLRVVDEQYRAGGQLEAFNRATHSDALSEMQLVPAEDVQPEYYAPIGDWRGLIKSLGWRRIIGAAAFATVIWTATAAFAVMCSGPR